MTCTKFPIRITIALLAAALLFGALFAAFCAPVAARATVFADGFSVKGAAAYLVDSESGTVMYAKNENDRRPIASMVKIMTALLTLEAVERGELSLSENVFVSENASGMGGSQVFLDADTEHPASQLIKAVIVCSANDACVALAERIAGSVEGFVADMNARASELGMADTHFANCTGLPAADGFSTARDVSVMFRELIKHPEYFEYSRIWLEDYVHPDGRTTSMTNTNKLVRFYNGCDGGKTGFTAEAKFCLAATAERNGMRPVAVVLGGESSKERFAAVSSMLDHAFGAYERRTVVRAGDILDRTLEVRAGKKRTLALTVRDDVTLFVARGADKNFELRLDLPDKIKAPVKAGDVVGKGSVIVDGNAAGQFDVVAAESVGKANLFDLLRPGR